MNTKSAFRALLATGVALAAFPMAAVAQEAADTAEDDTILVSGQRQQYRGDVPLVELPQSVQTIDSELLTDLNITTLDGALTLASGITRQNNFGGLWDAFAVRGFAGDENFPSGFLVNGFNGGRGYAGPRDGSNIERIEVLKGPNGAVFGRGEPGGTVNIITKKATVGDTFGSFTLAGGSFDTYRGELDLNIAIADGIAVRFNGAYEDSEGFRDYVDMRKMVMTPSVMFEVTDSTTFSYELEYVDMAVPFDRGIPAIDGVLGAVDRRTFLGEPGDGDTEVGVWGHQFQLQQELGGNNWVFLAGVGLRSSSFEGFSSDPELVGGRQIIDDDDTNLARQRRFRDYNTDNASIRGEISGRLDTGNITHHILFGGDWDRFEIDLFQTRFRPGAYTFPNPITAANNAINVFNPVYGQLPTPNVTIQDFVEVQKAFGFYAQDQIDLSDMIKLRVGGRYDNFTQRFSNNPIVVKRERFSPTLGVLFQATDDLGIYAAYGNGFRPNSGLNAGGASFEPETSRSYEAGLRYVSADEAITGTLAAYWMTKTNILTNDPSNANFSVAAGAARSRGIEADITANLPGDVSIFATYAYTDAEWTTSSKDPNFGVPILPGDPLINIPKHSANLVVNKGFDLGSAGRLTIGAGVNHVSSRLGETASSFRLPSYTLFKLMASYEPFESLRLGVDVTNLTDETYYASSYHRYWVAPGAPRSITVRATYAF